MPLIQPDVSFKLLIGTGTPSAAPPELVASLTKVSVQTDAKGLSGFSLDFETERYSDKADADNKEYPLITTGLLEPFESRVQIVVNVFGTEKVLIDGFITNQDISLSRGGATRIGIKGRDVSVKMDMMELSKSYLQEDQGLKASEVVKRIIQARYQSLGIELDVVAPENEAQAKNPNRQRTTDLRYIQYLAKKNACVFYVEPGQSAGQNRAYWGPPEATDATAQKALTINMGMADNLDSVSLSHQADNPALTYGQFLDTTQDPKAVDINIGKTSQDVDDSLFKNPLIPSAASGFAADPDSAFDDLSKLTVRGTLFDYPGDNLAKAKDTAQSKTDESVAAGVTVTGSLNTADYESILEVRKNVDLRGVGERYDGTYQVKSVTHSISLSQGDWTYNQSFKLWRGGLGTTIQEVNEP